MQVTGEKELEILFSKIHKDNRNYELVKENGDKVRDFNVTVDGRKATLTIAKTDLVRKNSYSKHQRC